MSKAFDYYVKTKEQYEKLSANLKKNISQISYLRLATFVVGVFVSIYTYAINQKLISAVVTIIWIGLFIYLVKLHEKAIQKKGFADALVKINERGIDRIEGNWNKFKDNGEEFAKEEHPYSGDLDIVGHNSLFQWISSCATYLGRLKLKDYLLKPLESKSEIKQRQEAVKELANKIEIRQKVNAEGMLISSESSNPEELIKWAETTQVTGGSLIEKLITNVLTLAFFTIAFLAIFTETVTYKAFLAVMVINLIVLYLGGKKGSSILDTIHEYRTGIRTYENIIKAIEEEKFSSQALKDIKKHLYTAENKKASELIAELNNISNLISDRRNMGYILINIAFMWDFRCLAMLNNWKAKYGKYLRQWLELIGEFEALSSIANIAFENEGWCFPDINEEGFILKAENLGHPLLGKRRVCNDVTIKDKGSVLLITGSNMSGKSTFLRTVGINLVMSYCGAPVCASKFTASIMNVYTCMRVSDNLEKSISSFYAEILRIKMIVNASKANNKIFFLLDEIFKGTNSIDRHLGASMLIKQLSESGASGMVSTHDLELGELENKMTKISNYHFQEHYENGELRFDYKLRKGISTTRNAMHIIKMAGIEVE
ncbi:MAG: DNA repair protein [Clostridiales bacterium]|uniref:MutS family DNA mismatch repair protein n=1 Tax=Clostridium sp. N3C TaxID=1776758 RepID=UPI00092E1BE4|nr:MutS family DNA mismatch repair protein [Clostridium sp. N3C]NLZ47391.1 DNA repair protein [Clostridiales bacterium]SCN25823.1 DNA mismatch repair protein MutS [Clostridium sp. N3C]